MTKELTMKDVEAMNCPECLKEGVVCRMEQLDGDSDGELWVFLTLECPRCGHQMPVRVPI